jgi:hypothetical protein
MELNTKMGGALNIPKYPLDNLKMGFSRVMHGHARLLHGVREIGMAEHIRGSDREMDRRLDFRRNPTVWT